MGKRLSNHSALIGAVVGAATLGAAGPIAEKIAKGIGTELDHEQTIQEQHQELSQILDQGSKRYLVIIDDIDRLEPAEMLQIFKLVKSVGRLPNVMYLLVFDLARTEKVVADAFPAEDAHYLEKILQASFALPAIQAEELQKWTRQKLSERIALDEIQTRELSGKLKNFPYALRQPRDAIRLLNSLEVTWPALEKEVHPVDFVVLELLRLFYPRIHHLLSQRKELLCYSLDKENSTEEWLDQELGLNSELSEPELVGLRILLATLFSQTR
ncbi:P-loop NTPase fold protein [Deefgea sp. CFH1-16]|uniref:P-loop NTPase fold protein n=1 Tax=Deefgea sp. CFH1-16 TaxID=2675457 RepID=UPI00194038B5|nr:P-loop NTPase fold protein [Deefgea sp. CFH1-16]